MDLRKYLNPIKADKIRIGPNCDGGYVVAKKYLSPYLYSYGVGNQVGFEVHYNNLVSNCRLKLFDGTIDIPNKFLALYQNAIFFQKNVYHEKDLDIKEQNVFVQMDIEGAELDIFNSMSIETIQKIQQLCIEVHLNHVRFEQAEQFFKKLQQYFYLVHIHGNNWDSGKKFGLPAVLELTYVNKTSWIDLVTSEDKHCPVNSLDFPNDKNALDLMLDWWVS